MNWIHSIDWGLVLLCAFAIAFTFLMLKAFKRRRRLIDLQEPKPEEPKEKKYPAPKDKEIAELEPPPKEPKKIPPKKLAHKEIFPKETPTEEKERLAKGLVKTRSGFIAKLGNLFKGKQLDDDLLDQIEEVLFTADIGVQTSQELINGLRKELDKKSLKDLDAIWAHLKSRSIEMIQKPSKKPLNFDVPHSPFVLLVVGVNGVGKTTTIGKIASHLKASNYSVLLAAGDTFRAAAVEQLEIWGQRAQTQVIKGTPGSDPASVIVETLKQAKQNNIDVVIADTAGRLHTKVSLMEELQKIRRVIGKQVEGAPHETFLVLDATTGQNAIAQAKLFKEALEITGIILTKLDGTAKGGVVLGICNELEIPVRFVGIGEKVEDLREFDPYLFVEALYEKAPESQS